MNREDLIARFANFRTSNGGIESLVSENTPDLVVDRLIDLEREPLSKVQFNQLLGLREEIGVSDGFFRYYWSSYPRAPYKLSVIPGFSSDFSKHDKIQSLDHLLYGLNRIFIDGLLYRGNVRGYFREFAVKSYEEIDKSVCASLIDTEVVKRRGPSLPLKTISKDNRYLISEMACKSYGEIPKTRSDLKGALLASWEAHEKDGGGPIKVKELLTQRLKATSYSHQQGMLEFSATICLRK
jgi:hypothetical protein